MSFRRTVVHTLFAAPLVLSLVAACSSSKKTATTTSAAPTTAATASSTTSGSAPTTAGSSTTTSAGQPSGCRTGPGTVPAGAHSKQVADVDGDGKPDTAWITGPSTATGAVTFGISTAAGGGATTSFTSASPVERSALVVDADQQGPVEIILSDGRAASLYAFKDCAISKVLNPQGQVYAFDLGDRVGTGSGIGCVDTPAGRRLAGLNARPSPDGTTVTWTRTVIELDGLAAHNGAVTTGVYHLPADKAKVALLDDITCGSLTIHHDGVTAGP